MCGIAGWYRRGGKAVSENLIKSQCDAIIHRGPDDAGYFVDADFGMGMRRLSIIDLEGGHQPIFSSDGRYVIVFNGEIFNHLELRPVLEARGYCFSTHSDTETLLAAYVCWGDDAWIQLEGMYAAAIWDRRACSLTLARDPVGIKPLYISEQDGGIAFGSELRTLTALPELRFDVDERALHDFVSFGYVQRPRSIYRQVTQLDPGHVMHIDALGEARLHRFWKPRFAVKHGLSEAEWVEETQARVRDTVRKHLLADVPVGTFLSGGVDSSAITAAMMRETDARVTAFTVGFPGHASDETDAAAEIARHLGCDHIVLPVEVAQARDAVPAIARGMDEPLGVSAVIPCWYVSQLASEHVKVVLCGEGGDELFAGYKRQRNALKMARWQPMIEALGPVASLLGQLPLGSSQRWNLIRQQIEKVRDSAQLSTGFQRCLAGTQISTQSLRSAICSSDLMAAQERPLAEWEAQYFSDPDWQNGDMIEQFLIGDLTVHMPGALLPRLDRTSMAHSLEARVPFLSHQFIDWAMTVPTELKVKGKGKYVLREAARPWLPEGVLDRPKQGFQMPLADWFRGGLSDFGLDVWKGSGLANMGVFDSVAIERLFLDHTAGKANYGKLLYALTVLGCWWDANRRPA